jgi:TRAP-type C4-dicarboxylate transport system substrate-binding protein
MFRMLWFGVIVACASMVLTAAAAEPIKIRVSVQFPVTEPFIGASLARFKAAVEQETDNAIVVEIFERVVDDLIVGAMRSGEKEMGVAANNQISRLLPAASLLEQPFLFNYDGLVEAAISPGSEIRKLIDDAVLEKFGLRVLWWQTLGLQVVFSKDVDVGDPSRVQNRKFRTYSDVTASLANLCGGSASVASAAVVHKGLKDGTFEMAMMSAPSAQNWKLFEVANVLTRTNHAAIAFLAMINERTWQSLSDKHKAVLVEVSRRVEQTALQRVGELEAQAFQLHRSKGVRIHDLSPYEVMQWRACSATTIDEYMESGGEFSRVLMDAYGRLRTHPCCTGGPPLR